MADINISKSEAITVTGSIGDIDLLGELTAAVQNIWADKYGGSAEYRPLHTPLNGPVTITITSPSAEEEARNFTVFVYYEQE